MFGDEIGQKRISSSQEVYLQGLWISQAATSSLTGWKRSLMINQKELG
jgi:hypothetical protein